MFLYNSSVFFIIFNLSWQMNLLVFDMIYLNKKRLILMLIPINGLIAWIARVAQKSLWSNSEIINIGEIFTLYFIVFSEALMIFWIKMYKYLPAEYAIAEDFNDNQIRKYAKFMTFFSLLCLVTLVFNVIKNQKNITIIKNGYYSTLNLLLIFNIFINLMIEKKLKIYQGNLK